MNILKAILAFAALALVSAHPLDQNAASALQAVAKGTQDFTIALHQVFREDASSNTITSPLSLEVVLGMIAQGAKGTTKTQLQQSLYLPADDDVAKTGFRQLLAPLKSNGNITLDLADAAFLALDFQLDSTFQKVASDYFKASTTNVDFAGDTSGSVDTVNKWVEDHTNGKITNLVPGMAVVSIQLTGVQLKYGTSVGDN
ncbi:unnamed protein product [Timema podura]|uniref:Serpin domain-containing protein n=1 Tax=Timema podura TaxID=61482 RepID=A0ABN7NPG7_TIMPD|nr:unnamed protein product [Timema podura]